MFMIELEMGTGINRASKDKKLDVIIKTDTLK